MGARFRSWWGQIKTHLVSTILIALLAVVLLLVIFGGYKYNWDWTGFNRPSKTLWDWLQLLGVLAVPVVVGFGAVWFTTRQTRISEENRKQQHDTELQIAEIQQQEELLRTYFDKISDLLLDKELSTNPNIQSIVRARTLAALHILNTERKAIVLRFLHDSGLLQYVKDFLYTLDLNHADLYRIDLSRANLNYTNLRGADLSGADFSRADFFHANLSYVYFWQANLSDAKLRRADLSRATLIEANLSNADLSGAKVTQEQLDKAKSLKGATMPDGSLHP